MLIRRPARGKAGLVERVAKKMRRNGGERLEPDPKDLRSLRAASQGLVAALTAYGATLLGDYVGPQGNTNSEMLELLSALYNGEMRPVRKPADDVDIGHMLPYRRVSFGLDAIEMRGSGSPDFGAVLGLKDYPEATSPGLLAESGNSPARNTPPEFARRSGAGNMLRAGSFSKPKPKARRGEDEPQMGGHD